MRKDVKDKVLFVLAVLAVVTYVTALSILMSERDKAHELKILKLELEHKEKMNGKLQDERKDSLSNGSEVR